YPLDAVLSLPPAMGIAADHCRGFWCDAASLPRIEEETMCYAVLPRLSWLAPARLPAGQGMTLAQLRSTLEDMFSADDSPVMVAQCRLQ
ncbi:DUF1853 family protein, partial [Salmonella enterica]|uniref:DUF1853 family protein n=2 Tax=Pseudomonadota TaxID=1224 RepID=UPI003CE72DD4